MAAKLKILLSAYACEPDKGSEPEAGWQWATRLARTHAVTVVTRTNNQASISAGLARLPAPHPQIIYYDLPPWLQCLKRKGLPVTWYYALWQWGAYWYLRARASEFEVIHHVTFNSYRWAGFWWLTGKPLVLGPLGGGQICPPAMLGLFGRGAVGEWVRSLLVRASGLNLFHRRNCRVARCLLVANHATRLRLPKPDQARALPMLDAAIEPELCAPPGPAGGHPGAVHFIWVGAVQRRKALPLALQALRRVVNIHPQVRLSVVGAGPEWLACQKLAATLGLSSYVTWHGRKARAEVARLLAQHDGFLFTSVRDTSGYVLLEAMLAGLPVITLNHQGAAEMTTDETALRIPPTTISETVAAFAAAMLKLAGNPELRRRLGAAGRAYVLRQHTWEQRVAQMNEIYARLEREI